MPWRVKGEMGWRKAEAGDRRGPESGVWVASGPCLWAGRAGSARCLQCREEAAGAAVDREEREEDRSAAVSPARCGQAGSLDRWIGGGWAARAAVCDRPAGADPCGGEAAEAGAGPGSGEAGGKGQQALGAEQQRQRGAKLAEMSWAGRRWGRRQRAVLWAVLLAAWEAAWGQLRYSVPEELPKGSFVGDVAKDLGLQLPELRARGVRIVSEGQTQYFFLHGKTGHLVTAERIDREQLCRQVEKCVLPCELIVEGEMKFYEIEVEIKDINDNAPSFREAEIDLRMSETTAPGSRFPLPDAHDPDWGRNSVQSYELSGDEHFSLAVQAGPGGDQRPELVLAKALDREEAAFHELLLRAMDGGDPARTGTARIRVTVVDTNDNAPVFSQAEYTVRVPEDVPVGSVLVTVTATDADEGLNGHVKYSIQQISEKASHIFQLDSEKGEITLLQSLDFEKGDFYKLEVEAHDGGGLFDTAKVMVTVTDVNDNAPELTVSSALSEISEDAPSGTVVALLHVQDRDSGANGEVRCSLDGDVPFRLQNSHGSYYRVVTARELDREQVSEYNVTVRAADGGSPALQSSAVLALRVLDVNDNAPVFAEERYSARVGRTQYFALHGKTGHLVTAERIDREQLCRQVEKCVLRCELIVEGEMEFYEMEVEIMDINDNAPSFGDSEIELRMSETTAPGSRFPLPDAHDPDWGRNSVQSYELSGDEHFSLAVQAGPGGDQRPELVLAKALDREEAAFHELLLRAMDGGDPARTGTARIRVTVVDANDNAPVFSQAEYTVRVPEDVPVGSVLVTVTATDTDEGLYGKVKYSLKKVSDLASDIFRLDSDTGEITLLRSLDFEEGESYELGLQAHDGGGLFDTTKVTISITDVNDNVPEISVRSSITEISEDTPLGTVVALLHVQDRDSGANGKVHCSLDGGVPFRLQSSHGSYYRVLTARELDREQVSEYNVTVRAADGGSPALQSSAVLALRVLDVNDNAPVFAEERYSARVVENNAAGALVLTVRATDADWGQNARVRYRLAEGRVRGAASRAGSARCLQCREEAAGAAVDREEREEDRSAAGSPARCGQAGSLDRWI
ncbi:protocadherin gamma-A7-like, partial [Cyanistes caeruleus]|uniref:protocadherin gamma-A7-like n=1 Tax=Cyanistes caeruleus TaxID=156563 RepID=UPI000CDADA8D